MSRFDVVICKPNFIFFKNNERILNGLVDVSRESDFVTELLKIEGVTVFLFPPPKEVIEAFKLPKGVRTGPGGMVFIPRPNVKLETIMDSEATFVRSGLLRWRKL